MSANIQLSPKHRTWVLVSCILQQFAFLCISFGYGLGLPQIVAGFNKSEYYALVGVVYSRPRPLWHRSSRPWETGSGASG